MKRLLSVFLSAILMVCMVISAGAVPNNFIESPSAQDTPKIISYHNDDPLCDGKLLIKSYGQRDELDDPNEEEFVFAFHEFVNAENLTDLTDELLKLAQAKGVSPDNLAVADLFYIEIVTCSTHNVVDTTTVVEMEFKPDENCKTSFLAYHPEKEEVEMNPEFEEALARAEEYIIRNMTITDKKLVSADHGNLTLEIKSDNLANFVGLLNYSNDEWSVIKSARINENGNLQYTSHKLGAFAVIVDKSGAPRGQKDIDNPKTGEFLPYTIYFEIALVISFALIVFLVVTRKRKHS